MRTDHWRILLVFMIILMLGGCASPTSQESLTQLPLPAATTTPIPLQEVQSFLDQGKILQLVSDKVYQVLVKKKVDHLISYNQELPTETLPYELRESSYISIGTAFSLLPGKYISCAHVFNLHLRPNPEEFFLKDAKGKIYRVTQIHRYSVLHDFIEFSLIDDTVLPTLNRETTSNLMGQTVYSIGNALGVGISVRSGVLSSYTFEPDFGEWKNIRFSAPASPGNSGGPLVNAQGQVMGIIQAKSENENLNYALPIALIDEISSQKARVKAKQQFSPYGLRNVYVIDFQDNLPQKIEPLQRSLYAEFQKAVKSNAENFFQKNNAELFNGDKKIESYLSYPTLSRNWQKLIKKRNGLWATYNPPADVEKFSDGDELAFAITGQMEELTIFFAHFLYQKKNTGQLEKLMENPAPIMPRTINQILGGIKFGQISIDVKEVKNAEETYWYRDQLKRLWRLDFWRLKTFGLTLISACTAHPKGLACHIMPPMESTLEGYGAVSLIQYELDSWMLSPTGTYKQWKEYLDLPTKYQWPTFENARMSLNKNKLSLSVLPYALDADIPDIFNRLEIGVNLGYEEHLPLKIKNHGLSIFDSLGRSYFYHLGQSHPTDSVDDEQKVLWKQTIHRQAEFSGDILKDQQEKKMILVGTWSEGKLKEIKPADNLAHEPTRVEKVFCYTDLHQSDAVLKDVCELFSGHLRTTLTL